MSNVYDQAYALARAIRESDVYKQFKQLQNEVNADSATKQMLDDFRKKQLDLQLRQMQGEQVPQEELDKMQKLYEVVRLNPAINRLLEVEQRFGLLMEDLNKIMAEPLKDLYQE